MSFEQLYILISVVLVLANARLFYGSLKNQTEHLALWFHPENFQAIVSGAIEAPWSAPLDDVFIHFDFARATARGYPFEWIEGNGYSSGGTSLLYPFVLAIGYLIGLTGLDLAHWAFVVACIGIFATLLGARRLFKNLPGPAALLAPPTLLAVGALNWTLFSGMEVAVFLALWAMSFVLWDDLMTAIENRNATRLQALLLGLACALLVSARPEAAPLVAIFGIWCSLAWLRQKNRRAALETLLLVGVPGALIVLAHMVANKVLTGSSAAAGALAKLEMHHPYLTSEQVLNSWVHFFKYQILRLSDYHFSSLPGVGYLLWPLAGLSLAFKSTRRYGILLWLSVLIWFSLIALNGQVRWQNERYTMPAVAWLLLAAALGMGATLHWAFCSGRTRLARYSSSGFVVAAALLFVYGQAPRFRDQVWFFGRASRNILEQHVRAAYYLKQPERGHRRVLISDAGAIPFMSDLPAIDLIGLGGYGRLPMAGASRQGVGAAIELLEHVPPQDLPNVMALYPSWWGDFVLWFGRAVHDFPVRGNVICGGASKVIYTPNWAPILHSGEPTTTLKQKRIVDIVDVADVLSEKAHHFTWSRKSQGYVSMKMLPDPRDKKRDLWDAGRLLSTNMTFDFRMSGFQQGKSSLLLRVAPAQPATVELRVNGQALPLVKIEAADHWQEIPIDLPAGLVDPIFSLKSVQGQIHVFHLFAVEASE